MSLGTIILLILVLLLLGVFPSWPHSQAWGNGPVSIVGVILIVVLILLAMGKL